MSSPYRVIVWGPGAVGRACLRTLIKRDDCQIVGVLAYSLEKAGKDVGDLIDHPPIGVAVTTDKEAIFALDADVVLYAGMLPFDAATHDSDIIRLLESGKNVVTAVAFHYAHNHDAAYVEKFEAACRKGGVSLHGSGENPGFWFERLALTLTGACSEVNHLQLHEFADLSSSGSSPELLAGICFGFTPEQAAAAGPMDDLWKEYYFVEIMNMGSIALFGRPLDKIEHMPKHYLAEHDVVLAKSKGDPIDMTIPQGRVHAMSHTFTGYLDGKPRLTTSVNWFLRLKNSPFPANSEHCWLIEIEGKPVSLRCEIGAFASLKDNLEFYPGDPTTSTYYITAAAMINTIPVVVSHDPGIVYPSIFATSNTDLHRLAGRKTIVG